MDIERKGGTQKEIGGLIDGHTVSHVVRVPRGVSVRARGIRP